MRVVEVQGIGDGGEVVGRKAPLDQAAVDVVRHTNDHAGFPLKRCESSLVDRWRQPAAVVFFLRGITAVERHYQWHIEGASNRQCERATPAKMRVNNARAQCFEVRPRGKNSELLEDRSVKCAQGATPSQY